VAGSSCIDGACERPCHCGHTLGRGASALVTGLAELEDARLRLESRDGEDIALVHPDHWADAVRVVVTLPSEAATDYRLVHHLVTSGMDVARINGAHSAGGASNVPARQRVRPVSGPPS
jgi:hypothetical protein